MVIAVNSQVVDIETGERDMPPGEVGEIIVRGPQVMQGYWNAPEETARALRDGWLYTGDIGWVDEEGYIYIVDRKKEMIKYKSFSIAPAELEAVLLEHPDNEMKKRLKRLLAAPFVLIAAIIVLVEEWLWDDLQRVAAAIGRLLLFRQIESLIAGLPPYAALALFGAPSLLLIPVKLAALYFIAHGQPALGLMTAHLQNY